MMSSTCDNGKVGAYLLRPADSSLVLAQRLCELIGHAHAIEEELALGNIGLDLLGQARAWLSLAGELEGGGRDEDKLAFFRGEREWRNLLLCEQANGDFAHTVCKHVLFGAYHLPMLDGLAKSAHSRVAGIAASARREAGYHFRHFSSWFVRFGAGTAESRRRLETALARLWPFCGELFDADELDREMNVAGIAPDLDQVRARWVELAGGTFAGAGLAFPGEDLFLSLRGRDGIHSEHLGLMLAEMQSLPREHPGAWW